VVSILNHVTFQIAIVTIMADYTVAVWDCRFYLVDDNGQEKTDEHGNVILYSSSKLDFSHIAEYAEIEDLDRVGVYTNTGEEMQDHD